MANTATASTTENMVLVAWHKVDPASSLILTSSDNSQTKQGFSSKKYITYLYLLEKMIPNAQGLLRI